MFPTYFFMWQNRSLYFGPLQHVEPRLHGAPVLLVGLYKHFQIRIHHGALIECECAIVPAGVLHELELSGNVLAKLFIERDSPDYWAFQQRFNVQPHRFQIVNDASIVTFFREIYEESPAKTVIKTKLDSLIPSDTTHQPFIHPRIMSVLDLLRNEPEQNHTQFEIAETAHLSASRFQHLFRHETGIPYRRYRIWKRLGKAIDVMRQTDCMTQSAMDAGFSDASHFSHCFKDFFGANPSFVFKQLTRLE